MVTTIARRTRVEAWRDEHGSVHVVAFVDDLTVGGSRDWRTFCGAYEEGARLISRHLTSLEQRRPTLCRATPDT